VAALALPMSGCFVEAEVKEVCQRTPTLPVAPAPDGSARPLALQEEFAFAVPLSAGERSTLDVTLLRATLRAEAGAEPVDFLTHVDIVVRPAFNASPSPLKVALAARRTGEFEFEGAVDVTPWLTGERFRYALDAQGIHPASARALEAEVCTRARLWLSFP
jgi:hypothetical protein